MAQYLKTIKNDMIVYGRNPNRYERHTVTNLETSPSPGTNTVRFKGIVHGKTGNYITQVQFFNVDFAEEKDKEHSELVSVDGKPVFHMKPRINTNPVFMKFSCDDFRFTWEYPAALKGALVGNWRRYTRKTPPIPHRPKNAKNPNPIGVDFKNPENFLGYCKHINSLLYVLRDAKRIGS